jgi:hypothetical protein
MAEVANMCASNFEVLVDSAAIAYLLVRQRRERGSAARSQAYAGCVNLPALRVCSA